jgi:isopentenyl-diphosphate delta-isomerase
VQAKKITTGFEDVHLLHKALPEISLNDVDTAFTFLGKRLKAPIILEAITGGTPEAMKINGNLADTAERFGIAMGVGSQRAALETPRLEDTFRIARERGPHVFLIANIGLSQILAENEVEVAEKAVQMINADALAVHLNILQEAIQHEGETKFDGVLNRLREVSSKLSVPVIAKETGAGLTSEVVKLLNRSGAKGIDVGGAGGTSWAAVESYRESGKRRQLGITFWDWGIPTAVSLIESTSSTDLSVIASGGVRTGLDVAKAISLGADAVGLALPLLKPSVEGNLDYVISMLLEEFRTSMFLVGARKVEDLKQSPVVVTGKTAEWLALRGFRPEELARRGMKNG